MKRFAFAFVVLMGLSAASLAPRASAQELEVEGPLAGAPAVIGMRIYRDMRLQIQAHASMTLQDEYSRAILGGGQLQFHFTDWLGVGIWGGAALANLDTALADEVTAKGETNEANVLSLPSRQGFAEQLGRIKWIAAPQVTFIPLRGKMGMFESVFVDTDLYIFGGLAIVGLEERMTVDENTNGNPCAAGMPGQPGNDLASRKARCAMGTQQLASRTAVTATFGAGLSMYVADWMALTLEWRGLPFSWNTSGTDEACSEDRTVWGATCRGEQPDGRVDDADQLPHFNHTFTLGFAFFLPGSAGRSFTEAE